MKKIYLLLLLVSIMLCPLSGKNLLAQESTNKWEYKVNENDEWEELQRDKIQNYSFTGKEKIAFFRTKINKEKLFNTYLIFNTHSQNVELSYKDRVFFKNYNDNIKEQNNGESKNNIINLTSLFFEEKDVILEFKVYSPDKFEKSYSFEFLDIEIIDESTYLSNIPFRSKDEFLLGSVFLFIGLILLPVIFSKKMDHEIINKRVVLGLSIFSISSGFVNMVDTDLKYIFISSNLFWRYAFMFSYLMPVGLLVYIEGETDLRVGFKVKKREINLIRIMKYVHVVFAIVTFLLDVLGVAEFFKFMPFFGVLFIFSMVLIIRVLYLTKSKVETDISVIKYGGLIACVLGIQDILAGFGFFPGRVGLSHFGIMIFLLSLILDLFIKYIGAHDKLKSFSSELEKKVEEKTEDIKNLLNNASQGFLSFDEDYTIQPDYSNQCTKIFGVDISGKNLISLLERSDDIDKEFLKSILQKILKAKPQKRSLYYPLLPEEIQLYDRNLKLEFKVIKEKPNSKMMLIITDITHNKQLETQVELERNKLNKAITVVVNFNDFIDSVRSYKQFVYTGIDNILKSDKVTEDIIADIYRKVHTFKGSFSQLALGNIVKKLHDLENDITNLKEEQPLTKEKIDEFIGQYNMLDWIEEEISTLKEVLGEDFIKENKRITVSVDKIKKIESRIKQAQSMQEIHEILLEIRKLRYKEIKELFKFYPDYVDELATRLDKLINPMEIIGGDELVDVEKYNEFGKSMVHIFRNMVDHGIEDPDTRAALGKDEYGKITLEIKSQEDKLHIIVSDDGGGIDLEKIKSKILEKEIYTKTEIEKMAEKEILYAIFNQEFSTKENVTDLSGRGVGLSAVKEEVEKLNGIIEVNSKIGVGTDFHILLPIQR